MKDLTTKKLFQRARLSIWLSDHLKFILKCFEIILFNCLFIILLVRFFCYLYSYLTHLQVKDFCTYFALILNQKIQNFYTCHSLLTPLSNERPGCLFEDYLP